MSRQDWKSEAEALLTHARAVRADAADGRESAVAWAGNVLPTGPFADPACAGLQAAMVYLSDEVALVRAGKAGTLVVLDDEITNTEAMLARL